MSTYILDTETTGVSKTDQVIELATLQLGPLVEEISSLPELIDFSTIENLHQCVEESRYLPTCPINPHAYAVHGISRPMLFGKPLSSSIKLPEDAIYFIGHNVKGFDKRLLGQSNLKLLQHLEDIRYICTLSLAKLISKHCGVYYEDHKLDTLTKHYYPDYAHILVTPLHSAKNDVVKNLLVLLKLVEHLPKNIDSWDRLFELQENIKKVR